MKQNKEIKKGSKVPYLINFFDKKEIKALKLKISVTRYKKFMTDVHKRIFVDMILGSKEGYLLPYKLGQLSIRKERKVEGCRPMYKYKDEDKIEYNTHSFGSIYSVNWNRETFSNFRTRMEYVDTFPNYNGLPLIYYKLYDFTALQKNKDLIAYQIKNQSFNHV